MLGPRPDPERPLHAPAAAADQSDPRPGSLRHPQPSRAHRDATAGEREPRRGRHLAAASVDPDHAASIVEQHPRRPPGRRHLVGPARERYPADEAAAARVHGGEHMGPEPQLGPGGRVVRASAHQHDNCCNAGENPCRGERDQPAAPSAMPERLAVQSRARGAGEVAAARRTLGRHLRQRGGHDVVEGRRQLRATRAGPGWRLVEVRVEHGQLAVAVVWRLAGQALEQHAAQRVHVGPSVHVGALDLLGGDVGDRAHERSVAGQAVRTRGVPGEPEVAQTRPLAGDQDVRRLDVAMDQAGGVRDVEARTDVLDERDGALGLECTLATQQRAQVLAVDPLHRDVEEPLVFAGVEHRDDAWMLQQRGDLALPQETLAEPGVGCERRVEHLERHGPPVGIPREVDGPGGTLTKQRLDPVAGDVRARREQVRHARRSYSCLRDPRPLSLRRRL